MVYVFDIDGTICGKPHDGDYDTCRPFVERIETINTLYDEGHNITYLTARGMGRHNNDAEKAIAQFYDLTKKQLESWGAKHHQLLLGKPAADLYVDDKGVNADVYFK